MTGALDVVEAIKSGDAEKLKRVLAVDPGAAAARDATGVPALLLALYHRRQDLAELLRPHLDALDVFEAAALGDAGRVAALVEEDGARTEAFAADGFTALHLAAFFGRLEVARVLVAHGAKVAIPARNPLKVHPLHSAAAIGHHGLMTVLLEHGADVNAQQQAGYTALHSRALHGDVDGVQLLLRHGADPRIKADDGRSALDMATEKGHSDVVALLKGQPA